MARSNPANQTSFSSPRGGKPRRDQARVHPLCRGRAVRSRTSSLSPLSPPVPCHPVCHVPPWGSGAGGTDSPERCPRRARAAAGCAGTTASSAGWRNAAHSKSSTGLFKEKKKKKRVGIYPILANPSSFLWSPWESQRNPITGQLWLRFTSQAPPPVVFLSA